MPMRIVGSRTIAATWAKMRITVSVKSFEVIQIERPRLRSGSCVASSTDATASTPIPASSAARSASGRRTRWAMAP